MAGALPPCEEALVHASGQEADLSWKALCLITSRGRPVSEMAPPNLPTWAELQDGAARRHLRMSMRSAIPG
jgi:hypothetical protein